MANDWRTSDGKVFAWENDARKHQDYLDGKTSTDLSVAKPSIHSLNQTNVDSCYYGGSKFFKNGDYDYAISGANQGLSLTSNGYKEVDLLILRGKSYWAKGDFQKAIADFNAIINSPNVKEDVKSECRNYLEKAQQGIRYTPVPVKNNSSNSSTSKSSSGGGSILFNIIGAVVVAIIGFNILGWLGLIGGAVGGFFIGKWLGAKIIGKILLIVALVVIGGGFIISKLPSTPAPAETTATEETQ